MKRRRLPRLPLTLTVSVLLAALVVGVLPVGTALAQPPPPAAPIPGGGPPGPGGPGPGGFGPGMMPMGPRMMGAPTPAIAVANNSVYVVLGGTIYKFDAETLQLQAKNEFIKPPEPPAGFLGPPALAPPGAGGEG
ncbi:MAG: hypothetical protein ACE5R4_04730 [Armatimonadota bacterium]